MASRVLSVFSLCAVCLGGVACAGKNVPQAAAPAASNAHEEEKSESTFIEDTSRLQPAPTPQDVVVRLRIKNPASLADGFFEAASLPIQWRSYVEAEPGARAIDLEGAVDLAVVLNTTAPTRPFVMMSFGTRGVGPVLDYLEKMEIQAEPGPGGIYLFQWREKPCAVGRAIAGSPARVVCSPEAASLNELLPYALRGLPAEKLSDAAVHLELDMRPVQRNYGRELSRLKLIASVGARQLHVGNEKFDRAVSDAAIGIVEEASALLKDSAVYTAQLFENEGSFRTVLSAQFLGQQSTTVASLQDLGKHQSRPPAIFDQLPSTASAASYSRELSSDLAQSWMSVLVDLASGAAEHRGVSAQFSERVSRVVGGIAPHGYQSVFARGPLVVTREKEENHLSSAWNLFGTERKKSELVGLFDDLGWLLSSKDFKKLTSEEMASFPKLTRARKRVPGFPGAVVYQWSLPEGSEELSSDLGELLPRGLGKTSVLDALKELDGGYLAVHELQGTSWVSWGQSLDTLGESFRAATSKSGEKLSGLGDLAGVRVEPAVSAGYLKVDGLIASLSWLIPSKIAADWPTLLRSSPHRGSVPLTHFFQVSRNEGTKAAWEMRIPVEFSQDLATLIVLVAAEMGLDSTSLTN